MVVGAPNEAAWRHLTHNPFVAQQVWDLRNFRDPTDELSVGPDASHARIAVQASHCGFADQVAIVEFDCLLSSLLLLLLFLVGFSLSSDTLAVTATVAHCPMARRTSVRPEQGCWR